MVLFDGLGAVCALLVGDDLAGWRDWRRRSDWRFEMTFTTGVRLC